MALIGTRGLQLKYWPFTLTILNLTRDNYQQIRLFIDSSFTALNSVFFFSLSGNIFLQQNNSTFTGYFPVYPHKTITRNKQLSFTELTFQSTEI